MLRPPVYYVYIAECADGTYYTGQTNNIREREKEHNGIGKFPGAKWTEQRRPVKIVHIEPYQTRSFAMHREKELKRLTHQQKYDLINCLAIF
jgi:putative endonuclease